MRYVATIALAAAMAAAGTAPAHAQQLEEFRWSGRIAQGDEVRIQGIAGDVHAEHTSGDRVEVVARRTGRDAAQVEVRAVPGEDGIIICAVYPGNREGAAPCRSREESDEWRQNFDAQVNFTVRVPAGVRLNVSVVSGEVSAMGLRSPVDVSAVAGSVRIGTTGPVQVNAVAADVEASFAAGGTRGMTFNTVSGNVTLRIAAGAGARVSASTLAGDISSDFDLQREPRDERRRGGVDVGMGRSASGRIGGGGPMLGVNTVAGDVRIVRAR